MQTADSWNREAETGKFRMFPISRNSSVKKTVRGCPFSKTVREADGVWAEVSG